MTDDAAREAVIAMKAKHTLVYATTNLKFAMLCFSDHKLKISTEYKIQNWSFPVTYASSHHVLEVSHPWSQ